MRAFNLGIETGLAVEWGTGPSGNDIISVAITYKINNKRNNWISRIYDFCQLANYIVAI